MAGGRQLAIFWSGRWVVQYLSSVDGHAEVGVGIRDFGDATDFAAVQGRRVILGGFKFCATMVSPAVLAKCPQEETVQRISGSFPGT